MLAFNGCDSAGKQNSVDPAQNAAAPQQPANEFESDDPDRVEGRGADTVNWWDSLPRPQWADFARLDDGSGWFEIYQVGPGVIAIYEPGQFEEVISYLISGSDRALLFDTGLGIGNIRAVVESLTDLPVVVLNSHSHYDHIGGNGLFAEIYGPDHPYTAARARGVAHDQIADVVAPAWVWKPFPAGFDAQSYQIDAYEISQFVADGSVIDLGGRSLEVLMTPGHAPDSLCLLDRDGRVLFMGDTFYPAPLYTHIAGSSFTDYVASAQRLAALAPLVDYLYPGHNLGRVESEYLVRMDAAFRSIAADPEGVEFVRSDGNRQYQFDGFSIITAEESSPAED